jgi:hypothetical protein
VISRRDVPASTSAIAPEEQAGVRPPDGHLTQTGPRPVWDDIEQTYASWRALGSPARERFGITVTPSAQQIWLDDPGGPHTWPLP